MTYPKPLTEKTLAKRYQEAGFSKEKVDFLHEVFLAAANLYGIIEIGDLWDVYKGYRHEGLSLHHKDLTSFSELARREKLPYYVYEINELYSDEEQNDSRRVIVKKELIGTGRDKYNAVYKIAQSQSQHPYYVPDSLQSFLSWTAPKSSKQEKELNSFLNSLRIVDKRRKNHGQRMRQEDADRIVQMIETNILTEPMNFLNTVQDTLNMIAETGAGLNNKQLEKLTGLMQKYHNSKHLWSNSGWAPNDLAATTMPRSTMPPVISIGPGIEESIERGDVSLEQILQQFARAGVQTVIYKGQPISLSRLHS